MRFSAPIIFFLLFVGCQKPDDQIQTYRVSKEADAPPVGGGAAPVAPGGDMSTMGDQMGLAAAGTPKDISWKTPISWTEQPPSSMRVASFLLHGANGQTADVSIVPLSGDAGGDLSNVNRWRGQLSLPTMTDDDLAQARAVIHPSGHAMDLVDFVSTGPLIDGRYKKRIVAAIYRQGDRTWFLKMTGDDQTVLAAKPVFVKFLNTLRFNAS